MKMSLGKKISLLFATLLILTLYVNQNTAIANAATPKFTKNKVTMKGVEETYQLKIKYTVKGSKYRWYSSNLNVASVTNTGLVTSKNRGTTTIRCKITYPSKKTKTILCQVAVKIPAEGIKFSNLKEENGSHTLLVGESYKFTYEMLPADSTDQVYWSLGEGDKECIRFDTYGNVTAVKAGKVVLVATAASGPNATSKINDAEIIEVVSPSASVKSAELTSTNEIQVVFESQIDSSSVIGSNGRLLDSITLTMNKNTKNVLANDPGALTAVLSSDLRTLTITSENTLEGYYGITFTTRIKTTTGIAMEEYYKVLTYNDNAAPAIASVLLDDSGVVNKIKFTEAIDITNLTVSNAQMVGSTSATAYSSATIAIIGNKANYTLSSDKRTLSINMANIASSDYGKTFSVNLSGIKDLQGNATENSRLSIYLTTDMSPKAQAQPIKVTRTSYNILTATFNRAIQTPGYATINGSMVYGVVDSNDSTKVNYTFTYFGSSLTGIQTVYLSNWNGYNVIYSDTSASQQRAFTVDFTADTSSATLVTYDYESDTSILTLTFNKEVTPAYPSGSFSAVFTSDSGYPGTQSITYAQLASTDKKVIKLQLNDMSLMGTYSFSLYSGFALDEYHNTNILSQITISNTSGIANELPGPYSITQSATNANQIILRFANKIDVASAQNIQNYNISGVTIISAVVSNTDYDGATVTLTIAAGSSNVTLERPITISGIMGYNGSYSQMTSFVSTILISDNVKPILVSYSYDSSRNAVCFRFTEEIKGSMSATVIQNGTSAVYSNNVVIENNAAYIMLGSMPVNHSILRINILSNQITDLGGNSTTLATVYTVTVMN